MPDSTERLTAALEGRYRVLRRLGEGGMALVYLAEDLKHHRQVALKILRPELAASLGPQRFLREIAIAARLTHPNILPLLDSGDAEGTLFYVMPFVEGESLRERLVREGQLPVDEAVKLAQRVAGALGYAHGLGVVHRDIKPENILLSGGEPVVTDFGIAKAVSEAGQTRLTETGFAVGTAPYMSPEQSSGERQLDGRSDLYSLGCVLYEMLAGAPPFTGPTLHAITARKLAEPVPPLRTVRDTVPLLLEQVVFKALARLPADRYATGQQLAEALEATRTSATTPGAPAPALAPPAPVARERWLRLLPWALTLAAIATAGTLALRVRAGERADLHLSVTTPRSTELYYWGPPLALSPDGSTLVFAAGRSDTSRLYVRRLDGFETRALPGTEGGDSPFFSPDGRWVGFFARRERQMRKVALAGGSPVTIAEDLGLGAQNGVWGPNDTIYFANWPDIQVSKVAAAGGPVVAVTHGNPPKGWFRSPLFLTPGGDLAVSVWGGAPRLVHVDLVSLRTGEHRTLVDGANNAALADEHTLLYAPYDRPELIAVHFDARTGRVSGDPVTVLDSAVALAASASGVFAFAPPVRWIGPDTWSTLTIVGRDGRPEPLRLPRGTGPRFSPDGLHLIYAGPARHGDVAVMVYDVRSGTERQVSGQGLAMWSIFSHDGRNAVFNWTGGPPAGTLLLYAVPIEGSASSTRLPTDTITHQQPFSWAAGGTELVYTEGPQAAGDMDLWTVPVSGGGHPRQLLHTAFNETQPAISPDGRWMAWMTDASGLPEVLVRRYPDGPDVPVSREGGREPSWGPGAREIYFRDLAGTAMMVAAFQAGEPPAVGTPHVLFPGRYGLCAPWCRSYDVSPDGRRFVMEKVPEGFTDTGYWADGTEIRIVPHFDREVAARMRAAGR